MKEREQQHLCKVFIILILILNLEFTKGIDCVLLIFVPLVPNMEHSVAFNKFLLKLKFYILINIKLWIHIHKILCTVYTHTFFLWEILIVIIFYVKKKKDTSTEMKNDLYHHLRANGLKTCD